MCRARVVDIMAECIRESDGGIPSLNVCGWAEERKLMSNSVTSLGVERVGGSYDRDVFS